MLRQSIELILQGPARKRSGSASTIRQSCAMEEKEEAGLQRAIETADSYGTHPARSRHRGTCTPITRSHRVSDPSPRAPDIMGKAFRARVSGGESRLAKLIVSHPRPASTISAPTIRGRKADRN